MSDTDTLRAMLDERGVEYRAWDGGVHPITVWHINGWVYEYVERRLINGAKPVSSSSSDNDGHCTLTVMNHCCTPEQAITATLGHDQRNCHNISDFNPVDVFTCSECGSSFKVRQFKIDTDGILDDETEFEFVPRHCPWCGAKVVDE